MDSLEVGRGSTVRRRRYAELAVGLSEILRGHFDRPVTVVEVGRGRRIVLARDFLQNYSLTVAIDPWLFMETILGLARNARLNFAEANEGSDSGAEAKSALESIFRVLIGPRTKPRSRARHDRLDLGNSAEARHLSDMYSGQAYRKWAVEIGLQHVAFEQEALKRSRRGAQCDAVDLWQERLRLTGLEGVELQKQACWYAAFGKRIIAKGRTRRALNRALLVSARSRRAKRATKVKT